MGNLHARMLIPRFGSDGSVQQVALHSLRKPYYPQ